MLFDKEFIEWIKENPILGLVRACELAITKQSELSHPSDWTESEHAILWEASSFISLVAENNEITLPFELPEPTESVEGNCQALISYIHNVSNSLEGQAIKLKINNYKNIYHDSFKNSFAYEFSKSDLDRVQVLINEIRTHISESQSLEENHRLRLLKRLEKLQSELHKRVSDLDRFWGLVGDAGVVLKKLGEDAKPIVDRVREIAEIIWKTQAKSENLPSGSQNPMLGQDEDY